jgi:hypothetical protein
MAKYEDYINPKPEGGIESEIATADAEQQARELTATPVDWEERYRNLEKLNSQQAQLVGEYRQVIDNYITNPTPASEPAQEESQPITVDDLYANPDEAVKRAVESHPAIQEARQIKAQFEHQNLQSQVDQFSQKHPDYQEIAQQPEFQVWVQENPTRMALAQSADGYDMNSADALFSLYKAEKGIAQITREQSEAQAINAASLESSTAMIAPQEEPRYSRSEYIDQLKRARQGDLSSEEWVKRNAAGYRAALESGNVRD